MTTKSLLVLLFLSYQVRLSAQEVPATNLLLRRYHDGEKLTYRMKAVNEGQHYEATAAGVVKADSSGHHFEEYAWSDLVRNDKPVSMPPSDFRQSLSLDPTQIPAIPDLSKVYPGLIGPILDFMTFYSDLWLAIREGGLEKAGDHFTHTGPISSWADGTRVILGQEIINFEISLIAVDRNSGIATLEVRHVPPTPSPLQFPANWMAAPVVDTQNNWVQIAKANGKYVAAVGKETFDVELKIRLDDGAILSGSLGNIVETQERDCTDAAVMKCGDARPHRIERQIEIALVQ